LLVVGLLLLPAVATAQVLENFDPDEPYVSDPQGTVPPFVPEAILWDNGPLATCSGCGAGGADESMLQDSSLGMNTLGFGHQAADDNRIADDFTISDPTGWDIEFFHFWAYQTGSTTTSTITAAVIDNLLSWRHSGFSAHGAVCVQDREGAVHLGRYMIHCPIVLEKILPHLDFNGDEPKATRRSPSRAPPQQGLFD
jgi:hypothetical protein